MRTRLFSLVATNFLSGYRTVARMRNARGRDTHAWKRSAFGGLQALKAQHQHTPTEIRDEQQQLQQQPVHRRKNRQLGPQHVWRCTNRSAERRQLLGFAKEAHGRVSLPRALADPQDSQGLPVWRQPLLLSILSPQTHANCMAVSANHAH